MSDNESHQSESMAREIINNASHTDEVLNDHRHQPASLPIRVVSPEDETVGGGRRGSAEHDESEGPSSRTGRLDIAGSQGAHPGAHGAQGAHGEIHSGHREELPNPTTGGRRTQGPSLRTEFYLRDEDDQLPMAPLSASGDGPSGTSHIPIIRGPGGSLAAAARRGRSRSRSFSEQVKILQHPHHTQMVPAISTDPNSNSMAKSRLPSGVPSTQPLPGSERGILLNSSSGGAGTGASGATGSSGNKKSSKPKVRRGSFLNDNLDSDIVSPLTKSKTNDSGLSEGGAYRRERRASRSSIDSDLDSRASRSSQETEEDVCFPMLREHVRINGIDFDEIEEFIKEEREEENYLKEQQNLIAERTAFRVSRNATSTGIRSDAEKRGLHSASSAALKYTPKNILKKTQTTLSKLAHRDSDDEIEEERDVRVTVNVPEKLASDSSTVNEDSLEDKAHISPSIGPTSGGAGDDDYDSIASEAVKFGGTRINDASSSLPDRFSFFLSESDETIHSPDIPSLVEPGQTVRELFKNGESTWWLDCGCPTDAEMKMIAKAFGIHPLTAEDIRMQETREKVELFRNYYFVCFHTFEPDKESEDYLEPINVYIVVFREGILSFHFSPVQHPANVRRRVRQLRDYVDVSADWLCYALIDDITDGFAPVITGIEYEADAIEDSVFVAREMDFSNMLQRIGESRRKVMTLMRLLSGKADVIKMFAKRCQDEALHHNQYQQLQLQQHQPQHSGISQSTTNLAGMDAHGYRNLQQFQFQAPQPLPQGVAGTYPIPPSHQITQPRADIALYLGDIQDHVVTMFQNLLAYEKIFSRSHSNYLAQLQVESFHSNNKVTEMLSKVTLLGTVLIPLNVITGLFGMNVHVPGEGGSELGWFFGIIGVMIFFVTVALLAANFWLNRLLGAPVQQPVSSRRSIKSLGLRRSAAKSILSFPNKYE